MTLFNSRFPGKAQGHTKDLQFNVWYEVIVLTAFLLGMNLHDRKTANACIVADNRRKWETQTIDQSC